MKVSLEWLAQYVALPPPDELARRLTFAGLEVEGVEQPGRALAGVVVAQVTSSAPHPNADKLSVVQVDVGGSAPLRVVCGAKNYRVGDRVPLATVGTTLPNGVEIKIAQLRGVESAGMLCSQKELGLSADASGLFILDPALPLGQPLAQALGLEDTVFALNVTPNRPDALCHVGVAREVAALTGASLTPPRVDLAEGASSAFPVRIQLDAPERCPRYAARVIEGVKVAASPPWLRRRLEACGVRSINNVVDATNYVMLELGQPLHAFDLARLSGAEIHVRLARAGETLALLDGSVRTLDPDDLLICDRDRPLVLAGVMGGATSEVAPGTARLLLESACFQAAGIRRSAKRHGLHTESSHRFERGTDPGGVGAAADRASALIQELAGGVVLPARADVYPRPVQPRRVTLRTSRVAAVLGTPVPADECRSILERLGFQAEASAGDAVPYAVPSRRVDVEREEDLIEEVARIRGYEAIPSTMPRPPPTLSPEPAEQAAERRVRLAMACAGFDEVIHYSFLEPAVLAAVGAPAEIPRCATRSLSSSLR